MCILSSNTLVRMEMTLRQIVADIGNLKEIILLILTTQPVTAIFKHSNFIFHMYNHAVDYTKYKLKCYANQQKSTQKLVL